MSTARSSPFQTRLLTLHFDIDYGENYALWTGVTLSWDEGDRVALKITVPAPNTVPTAADGTVMADEDTAYAFQATDFNFTDADTEDTLDSVTIVTVPLAGTFALSGTAVTAGDSVAKTDLDAGNLTFTPVADANGMDYASFTFTVSDGEAESTPANTITINVTPVNDPAAGEPTISGTAQVGQTLTADSSGITDVDGRGTLTYQWIRVDGTDADIMSATSTTYVLAAGDAGKKIKVRVSFTDDDGTDETLTSPAFPATGTVVGSAVVVTDAADLGTTEAGGLDTFQAALATQPSAQVRVGLTSSDSGEGTVSPAALTFTVTDWSTAQTVTVTGVDDSDLDGDQEYRITFAVTSTDTHYNGLTVNAVTVTNTNDDMVLNVGHDDRRGRRGQHRGEGGGISDHRRHRERAGRGGHGQARKRDPCRDLGCGRNMVGDGARGCVLPHRAERGADGEREQGRIRGAG